MRGPILLAVYGTRPEAIKMAPIIMELDRCEWSRPVIAVTGQHREMLDQVNKLFGIAPDFDLGVMRPHQTLAGMTARSLSGLDEVVARVQPEAMLVHGDTTSALAGALCAFYSRIPLVHVEAGLRTRSRNTPFPEEVNRRLIAQLAVLHLASTEANRASLLAEGVPRSDVVVTGSTAVDALIHVGSLNCDYTEARVSRFRDRYPRVILVTAHRRENWGAPLRAIAKAVARLARAEPEVGFIVPMHPNPVVRDDLLPPLRGLRNVLAVEPVPYEQFARLLKECYCVVTDSGGLQEEAPSLGKPVVILREKTDRPEAVSAGASMVVGIAETTIVESVLKLLRDKAAYDVMSGVRRIYGDGHAARRSVAAIGHLLGLTARLPDFTFGG